MDEHDNKNKPLTEKSEQKSEVSTGISSDNTDRIADEILDNLGDKELKEPESRQLTDSEVELLRKKFKEGMAKMKNHPWNDKGSDE